MLRGEDLWFRYSRRLPWVLRGAAIHVDAGEVVGLLGPSGAGKSTVGRLLAGYAVPDRGRVTLDGRPAAGARGRPHPVQLVQQHPELAVDPRWTVRAILAETGASTADVAGLDPALVAPHWLDRYPHEISGGELQRVALARALLTHPRFVVADEISASLDSVTQARVWHLLLAAARSARIGVLAISHDRPLLDVVADRVLDRFEIAAPATAHQATSSSVIP